MATLSGLYCYMLRFAARVRNRVLPISCMVSVLLMTGLLPGLKISQAGARSIAPLVGILLLDEDIESVSPDNGPLAGGNIIALTGNNISSGEAGDIISVTVKGVPVSDVLSFDRNHVYVIAGPAVGSGAGDVEIRSLSRGLSRKSDGYVYNPQGVIHEWDIWNDTVLFSGSNLGSGTDIDNVNLLGINAKILLQSSTAVYVQVGSGTSGTGNALISSTSYGLTVATGFTYPAPAATAAANVETAIYDPESCDNMEIISVQPDRIEPTGGSMVLISGRAFANTVQKVTLAGIDAQVILQTDDAIVIQSGPVGYEVVGNVEVQTANCGSVVLENGFAYRSN